MSRRSRDLAQKTSLLRKRKRPQPNNLPKNWADKHQGKPICQKIPKPFPVKIRTANLHMSVPLRDAISHIQPESTKTKAHQIRLDRKRLGRKTRALARPHSLADTPQDPPRISPWQRIQHRIPMLPATLRANLQPQTPQNPQKKSLCQNFPRHLCQKERTS